MKVYLYAALAAVAVSLAGLAYWHIIDGERTRADLQSAQDYQATRERIDDATSDIRGPDVIIDRLRRLAE